MEEADRALPRRNTQQALPHPIQTAASKGASKIPTPKLGSCVQFPDGNAEGIFSRGESTETGGAPQEVPDELEDCVTEEEFKVIKKKLDFSSSNRANSFRFSMSSPRFKRVAAAA